jgi:hypothetical protein
MIACRPVFSVELSVTMLEATSPRLTYAGLGKPINEDNMRLQFVRAFAFIRPSPVGSDGPMRARRYVMVRKSSCWSRANDGRSTAVDVPPERDRANHALLAKNRGNGGNTGK